MGTENIDIKFNCDQKLKNKLFELRRDLAKTYNVFTPSDILTAKSIFEIAAYYPQTLYELGQISDIGNVRIQKYGTEILTTVKKHLVENHITPEPFCITKSKQEEIIDYDTDLYNILIEEVIEFNDINNLNNNKFLTLTQANIKDICRTYPCTKEMLVKINGIGLKKIQVYSDMLLNVVQSYVKKYPDKVKENATKYSPPVLSKDELNSLSKEININLISLINDYPMFCARINLFKSSIYNLKKNFENTDCLKLIAGGELKTLVRNIVEPFMNLCLNINTTNLLVISKILNVPSYRLELISKYNIHPEEINALNTLYNYSNGCDHIFDGQTTREKEKYVNYMNNFEKLNNDEKYNLCVNVLKLINKLLKNTNAINKMEKLINSLYT